MVEDLSSSARIYTDIQGLKKLQYTKDEDAAKKEIAQQFEALMIQMLMHSMRDASKTLSSGLFSGNEMEIYQDMFDKQMSLMMSNSNVGIAKMFEDNIARMMHGNATQSALENAGNENANIAAATMSMAVMPESTSKKTTASQGPDLQRPENDAYFPTQEEFVKKLWSIAKSTAHAIGASPEMLIAQAALETNWGKNILSHNEGKSTHNLFNIKADADWHDKTAVINAVEQKDGVLVKEKSRFKVYESFNESFVDYVNLIKNNSRYQPALSKAANPTEFIKALHHAGYATDPGYSDNVLNIFTSKTFQQIIAKVKNI